VRKKGGGEEGGGVNVGLKSGNQQSAVTALRLWRKPRWPPGDAPANEGKKKERGTQSLEQCRLNCRRPIQEKKKMNNTSCYWATRANALQRGEKGGKKREKKGGRVGGETRVGPDMRPNHSSSLIPAILLKTARRDDLARREKGEGRRKTFTVALPRNFTPFPSESLFPTNKGSH